MAEKDALGCSPWFCRGFADIALCPFEMRKVKRQKHQTKTKLQRRDCLQHSLWDPRSRLSMHQMSKPQYQNQLMARQTETQHFHCGRWQKSKSSYLLHQMRKKRNWGLKMIRKYQQRWQHCLYLCLNYFHYKKKETSSPSLLASRCLPFIPSGFTALAPNNETAQEAELLETEQKKLWHKTISQLCSR